MPTAKSSGQKVARIRGNGENNQQLGQQETPPQPLTREEIRLAAQLREKAQFIQNKFNKVMQKGDVNQCIAAAQDALDHQTQLDSASLERLLEVTVRRGTQANFACALSVCAPMGLKVDVNFFVRMLTTMVQRGSPQVMFRIALNMPLLPEAPVVPLLPPNLDDEEEDQVFEDGDPLQDDKKAAGDAKKPADETVASPQHPEEMVMVGCLARPELNGSYTLTDAYQDFLEHKLPTYRKGEGEFYVYFFKDDISEASCWCIATAVGASQMLGTNFDTESPVPPRSGWMIRRPGQDLIADVVEFLRPEEAMKRAAAEEEKGEEPEEDDDPWPKTLTFVGGDSNEALAGVYKKTSEFKHVLDPCKPVYTKPGTWGNPGLYVFFREDESDKSWKSGWWIATDVGQDVNYALGYNPDDQSPLPPFNGWQIHHTNAHGQTQRRPHPGGFYHEPPESLTKKQERSVESLEDVVRRLDLQSLKGMVAFPDANSQAYFSHMCVLLHLEYLKELGQFRKRLMRRQPAELERLGFALVNLPVRAIFGQRWKGRYGALPGRGAAGGEQVALGLPQRFDPERCRIRRGESVMLSPTGCKNPLLEKVGEGVVSDVNDWEIVVNLDAHMPDTARQMWWRLDKSANHTAYERQFLALIKLTKTQRWRRQLLQRGDRSGMPVEGGEVVNSLLMSTPCGLIDEWADKMRERVDAMQAEKLQEKGLVEPEETEDAWEEWLNSEAGGGGAPVDGEEVQDEAALAEAASSASTVDIAAKGPPADEEKMQAARRKLSQAEDLNASQCRAINAALQRRCTVIQGPPGTGKTHVSVKLLSLFAKELGLKPLLATSDSNVAVDNICQGLVNAGIKAVRMGQPEKIRSHLEAVTLEAALRQKKDELKRAALQPSGQVQITGHETLPPSKRPRSGPASEMEQADVPGSIVDDMGWLKRVLAKAGLSDFYSQAAEWVKDTNCEECDFQSGEGVADLIDHLKLEDRVGERLWEVVFEGEAAGDEDKEASKVASEEHSEVDNEDTGDANEGDKMDESRVADSLAEAKEPGKEENLGDVGETEQPRFVNEAERKAMEAKAIEDAIIQRNQVRKKQRMEDYDLQMDLLDQADVICATTITAGSEFLSKFTFEVILVDEAAQATELSTIVPVVHRGTKRLILVGDHCQLPPAIISLEAETRGLSMSLYSRLVGNGVEPFFLNTQYRSHPKIAEFSAFEFYGGLLQSAVTASERPLPQGFQWPNPDVPVCFIELAGRERRDGDSRVNVTEANCLLEIVRGVLSGKELSVLDIGVVSPYQAQVRMLRKLVRESIAPLLWQLWNSRRHDDSDDKFEAKYLEIASVDSFQGREKELIVFSAVRNNMHGSVGFLADWRRLNVMLTRARRGLIIIGNAKTLKHDPFWQQFLTWCEEHECIVKGGDGDIVVQDGFEEVNGTSGGGQAHHKGAGKRTWSAKSSGGALDRRTHPNGGSQK